MVRPAFASVPRCCVKAKLSAGNQSEFRENTRLRGSSFIFLSVNRSSLEYPRAVFVVLFCSVGDPSLPEPAPGTHRGLPYGKQSAGRGNKACVNSIVPAAPEEAT